METLLAKALESKLKYYLRSYTRDQFKLQGRTVQLSNLDLNGDVLHSIIGLPSTLRVDTAHVGKLEIRLPPLASVMTEPTVVYLSTLDLSLKETDEDEPAVSASSPTLTKSTAYGFADKVADGMTVEVGVVNLSVEPKGGRDVSGHDAAIWRPPIASVTLRNLRLHTTNENWEVVNLVETRSFYANKKCIYVFRKLVWECMSVDLIPHPAMFENVLEMPKHARSDDGAKRALFGGERFLDNISGVAFITMHRTDSNNPLGLEVNLKLSEAVSDKFSEPGLRALMRLLTGMYACLMRPDTKPMTSLDPEVAGRSLITVELERVFIRVVDEEYRLELAIHSLHYVQGSKAEDGPAVDNMFRLHLGRIYLRDALTQPPVSLFQPLRLELYEDEEESLPYFVNDHNWRRIYPLAPLRRPSSALLRIYAAFTLPPPSPTDKKNVASQIRILCKPLQVDLQEASCFRIASLVADGLIVKQQRNDEIAGPSNTLHYIFFFLEDISLTVPLSASAQHPPSGTATTTSSSGSSSSSSSGIGGNGSSGGWLDRTQFLGASVHLSGFSAMLDNSMSFEMLDVESEAACFALWPGQPVDASQLRLCVWADMCRVSLHLRPLPAAVAESLRGAGQLREGGVGDGAGRGMGDAVQLQCMQLKDPRIEVAMVTPDGKPIARVPPPGGILRVGIACQELVSHTSRLQLLFILEMYGYLTRVLGALLKVGRGKQYMSNPSRGLQGMESSIKGPLASSTSLLSMAELASLAPGDSAVHLRMDSFNLRLLESDSAMHGGRAEGAVLGQLFGGGIRMRITHQSLGGAAAISWSVDWEEVRVECVETEVDPDAAAEPASAAASAQTLEGESEKGGEAGRTAGGVDDDVWGTASPPELAGAGVGTEVGEKGAARRDGTDWIVSAAARGGTEEEEAEDDTNEMRVVFWSGDKDKMSSAASVNNSGRAGSFGSIADAPLLTKGSSSRSDGSSHGGGDGFVGGGGGGGASSPPPPFLCVTVRHIIPYDIHENDADHSLSMQAKVGGVRLSGGWNYNEALLHRFGVLDKAGGGPGKELLQFLDVLANNGAIGGLITSLQQPSAKDRPGQHPSADVGLPPIPVPRDLRIDVQLLDWLFALEGASHDIPITAASAAAPSSSRPLNALSAASQASAPAGSADASAAGAGEAGAGQGAGAGAGAGAGRVLTAKQKWKLREQQCWHSSFRMARLVAHREDTSESSSDMALLNGPMPAWPSQPPPGSSPQAESDSSSRSTTPMQSVLVRIEGLEAFKPRLFSAAPNAPSYKPDGLASLFPASPLASPHAPLPHASSFPHALASPHTSSTPLASSISQPGPGRTGSVPHPASAPANAPVSSSFLALGATRDSARDSTSAAAPSASFPLGTLPADASAAAATAAARARGIRASDSSAASSSTRGGFDFQVRVATPMATLHSALSPHTSPTPDRGTTARLGPTMSSPWDEPWVLRSVLFSTQEPVCVEATKEEMEHLVAVCKMEVAAASRIAIGLLKLLQARGSSLVTQATINELVKLGERIAAGNAEGIGEGVAAVASQALLASSPALASLVPQEQPKPMPVDEGAWEDVELQVLHLERQATALLEAESIMEDEEAEDAGRRTPARSLVSSLAILKKRLQQIRAPALP